jgi:UDP-N-acetylmuramate--alanine ligase
MTNGMAWVTIVAMSRVHFIGIGGIHMSAVAKLLASRGVSVSGSDSHDFEMTEELRSLGFDVRIGFRADDISEDIDVAVYSDAWANNNPELDEARRLGIRTIDSHAFLAELFSGATQVVVTGTHGKSTTTAMLGLILAACGADPTVVVGTKCAGFPDGNLRVGRDDLLVVEGDEYHHHLLSYSPTVLVLNNIELDHVDVYPTIKEYEQVFADAIGRMAEGSMLVWNADDERCAAVVHHHPRVGNMALTTGGCITPITVGWDSDDVRIGKTVQNDGGTATQMTLPDEGAIDVRLHVPGIMNVRNAAMAVAGAWAVDASKLDPARVHEVLEMFTGCWRRFERIGTYHGAIAISDYAHHPTEVSATLAAARAAYPGKRIILVFQPHHRNRTKNLFDDFVQAFDEADAIILPEIYDVPGRESSEDADISSEDLVEAVRKRFSEDAKLSKKTISFLPSLDGMGEALDILTPGEKDIIIFMGAGAIDAEARKIVT